MASRVSLSVVPATAATWVKPVHPLPWHRSTRYPVTPTLSVEAVHPRLIWLLLAAVALKSEGGVGGVVSGGAGGPAISPPPPPLKIKARGYAPLPTTPGAEGTSLGDVEWDTPIFRTSRVVPT